MPPVYVPGCVYATLCMYPGVYLPPVLYLRVYLPPVLYLRVWENGACLYLSGWENGARLYLSEWEIYHRFEQKWAIIITVLSRNAPKEA